MISSRTGQNPNTQGFWVLSHTSNCMHVTTDKTQYPYFWRVLSCPKTEPKTGQNPSGFCLILGSDCMILARDDPFRLSASSSSPRVDWKAERDRIDLAAVATRLLGPAPGRRGERGRGLWWPCPFHDDRNPSFRVLPGDPWYRCFGCGEHGDAANLVMKLCSLSFPEAVRELAGGLTARAVSPPAPRSAVTPEPPPRGLPEAEAVALVETASARLWGPEGADALAYLTGPRRRLDPEAIRAARLGWTDRAEGVAWKPPGIVIPWFLGGQLALVKVRPLEAWRERFPREGRPPKYLEAFRDPARLVCYPGPEAVRPGRPLVVVEGEFDCLCLAGALRELAPVVTLGSASVRPQAALFARMLSAAPWYIATDGDDAGDNAAADGWPASARRVRPPAPFKDWTEAAAGPPGAGAAGVDLARWWGEILSGTVEPPTYIWDDLARWRWGPAKTTVQGAAL